MTNDPSDIIIPAYRADIMISAPQWRGLGFDIEAAIDNALPFIFGQADIPSSLQEKMMEVSVVLSDDPSVQALNKEFRGKDKPTNVLSFANLDAAEDQALIASLADVALGDVIMAYETLVREAEDQGKSFLEHFTHLLAHGILHLLGYDHIKDDEAEIMEDVERTILREMGMPCPYGDENK